MFGERGAEKLPKHTSYDCAIDLKCVCVPVLPQPRRARRFNRHPVLHKTVEELASLCCKFDGLKNSSRFVLGSSCLVDRMSVCLCPLITKSAKILTQKYVQEHVAVGDVIDALRAKADRCWTAMKATALEESFKLERYGSAERFVEDFSGHMSLLLAVGYPVTDDLRLEWLLDGIAKGAPMTYERLATKPALKYDNPINQILMIRNTSMVRNTGTMVKGTPHGSRRMALSVR